MKRILILLLSILWVNALLAQFSGKISPFHHAGVLSSLLQPQTSNEQAYKTTGIPGNRVVAQSTRDNTLATLSDSISLRYHLLRTSTYDYNYMIYPYNFPYSASPMFNFVGVFTRPQVLYDTLVHWATSPFTLVYGLYELEFAKYDSATSNLLNYRHIYIDSVTNKNMSYVDSFNTANNIAAGYWFNLNPGSADSSFKQFFSYNSSNKLTQDSIYELHLGTWRLVARSSYTYDGSNNLIQIDNFSNTTDTSMTLPLIEQIQYINTYDASNRLLTVLENYYFGTGLSGYVKDTFGYTGTYPYHTSWKEHQYDPINAYWAPMFYWSKTINAIGLPDTVKIQGFDSLANSWVPSARYVMSYDTARNPVTLQDYEYNFTAFPATPNFTTRYYYETFYNTTAVNNTTTANDRAVIFPNPAGNTVTISQLAVPKNSMLSITLMNVSGQMVRRESMPSQSEVHISVGDLQPGVYWVVVQDNAGKLLCRQAMEKR